MTISAARHLADVEDALQELVQHHGEAEVKDLAKRITGRGGRHLSSAIGYLMADLTAVRRSLESQKV